MGVPAMGLIHTKHHVNVGQPPHAHVGQKGPSQTIHSTKQTPLQSCVPRESQWEGTGTHINVQVESTVGTRLKLGWQIINVNLWAVDERVQWHTQSLGASSRRLLCLHIPWSSDMHKIKIVAGNLGRHCPPALFTWC